MFNQKKSPLPVVAVAAAVAASPSAFVKAAKVKSAETLSGNGALKYSTTNDPFVDQFSHGSKYREPRTFAAVAADCEALWAVNPLDAVKFTLFCRTIPRKVNYLGKTTEVAQKGFELKHESIMRMLWLSQKNPAAFWENLMLFVSLGSWHDIFTLLQTDLVYNDWKDRKLNWDGFADLIRAGLQNPTTSELVKKYLPQIKAKSQCKTREAQANNAIAKWVCSFLFGNKGEETGSTYKKYRKVKTSGKAHGWQQLISQKKFGELDFGKIHGRALSILVKSKFLFNTGLSDAYAKWVAKPETVLKYTGFVHELFSDVPATLVAYPQHKQDTVNKQFAALVEKVKGNNPSKLIVVRDTSGSMGSPAAGTNMSCYGVAKAMALFFSEFQTGSFTDSWIEFNSTAKMHTWQGKTPCEKWCNDKSSFVGGTNFQSVIDLFVSVKAQGVPEADFPTGILCISDGEFNPAQLGKTNVESALNKLRRAGFSEDYVSNFVIVLWNLANNYYGGRSSVKFETASAEVPNVFYFSGYSPSVISFLTEKIKNARELFEAAMNQEVLNLVKVG